MDLLGDMFNRKKPETKPESLPSIPPLKSVADIDTDDPWEAVEKFPSCILITEPILSDQAADYKANKITFSVTSKDQGWCNEDNFEGEYEGSWTWFEVAILRAANTHDTGPARDKRSVATETCIVDYFSHRGIKENLVFVPNPAPKSKGSPFWHLQRNYRGRDKLEPHTITWEREAQESETESIGWEFNKDTGAGSGVKFVLSLAKGDRVALIARAKQSGSVNYISAASIEITFDGVKPALSATSTTAENLTETPLRPSTTPTPEVSKPDPARALGALPEEGRESDKRTSFGPDTKRPLLSRLRSSQTPGSSSQKGTKAISGTTKEPMVSPPPAPTKADETSPKEHATPQANDAGTKPPVKDSENPGANSQDPRPVVEISEHQPSPDSSLATQTPVKKSFTVMSLLPSRKPSMSAGTRSGKKKTENIVAKGSAQIDGGKSAQPQSESTSSQSTPATGTSTATDNPPRATELKSPAAPSSPTVAERARSVIGLGRKDKASSKGK